MPTPTTDNPNHLDPLRILREEAIAAALAHGADRGAELADNLVQRYARRVGGFNAYVRKSHAEYLLQEVARLHTGNNTREVARTLNISARHVQRLVARVRRSQR